MWGITLRVKRSTFPKNEWDPIFRQAQLTMNLRRSSRINPRSSAEEQMNGVFDCNRTPRAPLGIKVLACEMPTHRGTWAEHGQEGWCIGPAPEHCQCHKVSMKKTKGIGVPPKVKFHPEKHTMPTDSSTDRISQAAKQLTHALKNPATATPFEPCGKQ